MSDETHTTTRRTVLKTTAAATATAATAGAAASPVSATHDGAEITVEDGFFDGGNVAVETIDSVQFWKASAQGSYAAFQKRFQDLDGAEGVAADLQDHINPRSEDYVEYVNDRDLGGEDREVLELDIVVDHDTVRLYLVAEYDESEEAYQSLELVSEDSYDEEHPDRDPDEKAVLRDHAAEDAPDDLEALYDDFIEPNEDVSSERLGYLSGRYGADPNVSSTLLGDDL